MILNYAIALTESPCKCLPDGEPCELLEHEKNNSICNNCSWKYGAGYINSTRAERLEKIGNIMAKKQAIFEARSSPIKSAKTADYGAPCIHGHAIEHPETGELVTLRYQHGSGQCIQCNRESSRRYKKKKTL